MRDLPDRMNTGIPCPECNSYSTLIVRTAKVTGNQFLGCTAFPQCAHTQELTEELRMRLLDAPDMFDELEF